LFYFCKDK